MHTNALKLFHAGDEELFETLMASVEPALRRQIRGYVGDDRDIVDDLFQDVSIKIFERRRAYRGDGPFGAWCFRVCASLCRDQLRRAARTQRRMPSISGQFDVAGDSRSDLDRTRGAEVLQSQLDVVTDAIVALAPRRRVIAITHWYLGWNAARIARELHLTVPTVWTILSQIRVALRAELAPLVRSRALTPS
jgi:RNA polymerase sigma factor (sigma-70 family)